MPLCDKKRIALSTPDHGAQANLIGGGNMKQRPGVRKGNTAMAVTTSISLDADASFLDVDPSWSRYYAGHFLGCRDGIF